MSLVRATARAPTCTSGQALAPPPMRTLQTDAYSEKDTPHQTRDPRPPTSVMKRWAPRHAHSKEAYSRTEALGPWPSARMGCTPPILGICSPACHLPPAPLRDCPATVHGRQPPSPLRRVYPSPPRGRIVQSRAPTGQHVDAADAFGVAHGGRWHHRGRWSRLRARTRPMGSRRPSAAAAVEPLESHCCTVPTRMGAQEARQTSEDLAGLESTF